MNHRASSPALAAGLLLWAISFLAIAGPAAAASEFLPDSTVTESWALGNGLKVVTRHIPNARAVAISVCYRTGSASDPKGREGLSSVLADIAFTAATAEAPERSRAEMGSLRPLGWNLKVTPALTHLCEIATIDQFPGVLHQVATRMRGVTVTGPALAAAVSTVQSDLDENYGKDVERALYYGVRTLATPSAEATLERLRSGRSIQGISIKEVQQRLKASFVPANAVLSLAGNLEGYDLHRLIDQEFGTIPGGSATRAEPVGRITAGVYRVPFPSLKAPVGAIGVIGPALEDTLHPSFALHALVFGGFSRMQWGPAAPPITTRFEFSVLDDPELVRFYPPIAPGASDTTSITEEYGYTVNELPFDTARDSYDEVLRGVEWLLGGDLTPELLTRMRTDPGALYALASGTAAREQWGGEAFWGTYRERFYAAAGRDLSRWKRYFLSRDHLVQLKLVPESRVSR